MSQRPYLLVSNDDGIDSFFLRALVDALVMDFEVCVVAPAQEQSWVGRCMSRSGVLSAQLLDEWPCKAWSVSGRPADCVNIGLHHLVERAPIAVVSGMNLGFNVSLPLTLGSGTVAAATSGALYGGIHAIALSLMIDHASFFKTSKARGHRDEEGNHITRCAAQRATHLIKDIIKTDPVLYQVHNINFPAYVNSETPLVRTSLALAQMPSLFSACSPDGTLLSPDPINETSQSSERSFTFTFSREWTYTRNPSTSDVQVVRNQEISYTILDWSQIG